MQKGKMQVSRFTLRLTLCAFFLGLAFAAVTRAEAGEMTFRMVGLGNGAQIISADGLIGNDTPALFRAFVEENAGRANLHAIVMINSNGGVVTASMELGKVFRQVGASVVVARKGENSTFARGYCLSACVYALMGGTTRVIPPEGQVAIHRMVAYEGNVDPEYQGSAGEARHDNGHVAAALARYCRAMGVDPAIIRTAEQSSALHVLSRAEIARWHLAASHL